MKLSDDKTAAVPGELAAAIRTYQFVMSHPGVGYSDVRLNSIPSTRRKLGYID